MFKLGKLFKQCKPFKPVRKKIFWQRHDIKTMYHTSVLLNESIEHLDIRPGGVYVDATFGGGGHSKLILEKLGGKGLLFGFDTDEDAQNNSMNTPFLNATNFVFVLSNFRNLKRSLRVEGQKPGKINGILADLGISSHQIDTPERGFSYRFDAPLDMRMNKNDGQTAADLLNNSSAEEIQRIFSEFGEVRNSKTLAAAIVASRNQRPIRTTKDLLTICEANISGERMRYFSQVFQALRMEVNDEIGALEDFLKDSLEMLAPGGRLAVITFHSIEDRLVKNFMKTGNFDGEPTKDFYGNISRPFSLVLKKPLEASAAETKNNVRARSAKLRVASKL